ncbi:MAG: ABC transporter permease, partial [Acidobacteria bacterium]|nr:ABC transporter permease [Acidobacteriota bacterium]
MRKLLLIARRDYIATVRTPAFIIGLVVAPILFGGGGIAMSLFKDKPDLSHRRVAVVDRSGKFGAAIIRAAEEKNTRDFYDKAGAQTGPKYDFETVPPETADLAAQRLALSDRVRRKQLFAFLEVGPGNSPAVSYYTNAGGLDLSRQWFASAVNNGVQRVRLVELGVEESRLAELLRSVTVDRMDLVSRDSKTGQIAPARKKSEIEGLITPFILVMLIAMVVLFGATPLLSAVTEDKTQRVVEMLLGIVTPFELMAGKVLAAVLRSLTSSAFYIAVAVLTFQGMNMIGLVPFHILPWFVVYLVADVIMLSAFAAALGAACNSTQDAQSLGVVLTAPIVIPLMIIMPILKQPNGPLATVLSLVPPFTPLLMMAR